MAQTIFTNRCPFCASGDLHAVNAAFEIGWYICCLSCESQGPIGETLEESLDKWGSRSLYGEVTVL